VSATATLEQQAEGCYRLRGSLTFATVKGLLTEVERITAQTPEGTALELDLAQVEAADSAGLVLLLEWLERVEARGSRLTLRNLPDELRQLAHISNVEALLLDPAAPANP